MPTKIQVRHDTKSNLETANPTLASGEPVFEVDTQRLRVGDGSSGYASVPVFEPIPIITTLTSGATLSTEKIIICNSATNFTLALPAAATNTNRQYTIKNKNSNQVTLNPNVSTETIDNMTYLYINPMESYTIICDGTKWWVI